MATNVLHEHMRKSNGYPLAYSIIPASLHGIAKFHLYIDEVYY